MKASLDAVSPHAFPKVWSRLDPSDEIALPHKGQSSLAVVALILENITLLGLT